MDGLVDISVSDRLLVKFELVPNPTVSGHVKFSVVKQPDPLPEPEVQPQNETSPVSSSDEEDEPEHITPPHSPTGSQSSDTLAGAPNKKKQKRKRWLRPCDADGKFKKP
jgi:hypothetical protein